MGSKVGGIHLNKETVRQYGVKNGRAVVWKDKYGVWHSSTNLMNTPVDAVAAEDLSGKDVLPELRALAKKYNMKDRLS